ncbi:MAG: hypothetical protein QOF75_844 [Gaiellaceae bacterium]|jgi:hypothetical protein|nr:hypothetical protein [Gaiellaceae bacterium]
MRRRRSRSKRLTLLCLALAAGVVAAVVSPAYASSRSGPTGGEGRGTVSGVTVSSVQWQLGAGDGLAGVSFRISPAGARTVRVRVSAGSVWTPCAVSGGAASCPLPSGTTVAEADSLAVTVT